MAQTIERIAGNCDGQAGESQAHGLDEPIDAKSARISNQQAIFALMHPFDGIGVWRSPDPRRGVRRRKAHRLWANTARVHMAVMLCKQVANGRLQPFPTVDTGGAGSTRVFLEQRLRHAAQLKTGCMIAVRFDDHCFERLQLRRRWPDK